MLGCNLRHLAAWEILERYLSGVLLRQMHLTNMLIDSMVEICKRKKRIGRTILFCSSSWDDSVCMTLSQSSGKVNNLWSFEGTVPHTGMSLHHQLADETNLFGVSSFSNVS